MIRELIEELIAIEPLDSQYWVGYRDGIYSALAYSGIETHEVDHLVMVRQAEIQRQAAIAAVTT